MTKGLLLVGAALAALTCCTPANADELKFFQGNTGYTGAFSGAGSVYQAIRANPTNCPGAGTCTSDVTGNPLNFNVTAGSTVALQATGQGFFGSFVWDDTSPNFGGLGVGIPILDSNDQINGVNVLHLSFAHAVTVTGLATLFDPGHVDDSGSFGGIAPGTIAGGGYTFQFSEDGTTFQSVLFANANNALGGVAVSGTDFYFKQSTGGPDFYVSGLTYNPVSTGQQCTDGTCTTAAVPGPIVGAGLPGLIAGCVFLIGLAKRRRQRSLAA